MLDSEVSIRAKILRELIARFSFLNTARHKFKDGDTVNLATLLEKRIVRKPYDGLKVLGDGELTIKLTVQAAVFTATAKEKIAAAGGQVEEV